MNKRVHFSWILAAFCTGILAGLGLVALGIKLNFTSLWLMPTIGVLLIYTIVNKYRWLLILMIISGIVVGNLRGAAHQGQLDMTTAYFGQYVDIKGRVSNDPKIGDKNSIGFSLAKLNINGRSLSGELWVQSSGYSNPSVVRGDKIVISGLLKDGFGVYIGSVFQAKVSTVIPNTNNDYGRVFRDKFSDNAKKAISTERASLGVSFLTGNKRALSDEQENTLRSLGLVHLVVASGFHLSLVVRYLRRPISKKSKYLASIATILVVLGFLSISGYSTSMVRASLVTIISLGAWYYGRSVNPMILLVFVAALTAFVNPSYMFGDVGWYLSFAAFSGVIILAPLLLAYFWEENKRRGFIKDLLAATLAAQILTFPIIAIAFQEYSPLALLSNLLIQPLVPFIMLFVFISGVTQPVLPFLAQISGFIADSFLWVVTKISTIMSGLPFAKGEVGFGSNLVFIYYFITICIIIFLWRKTNYNLRSENIIE